MQIMAASDLVKSEAPHVVILVFPTQGHIIPSLQFSKKLASEGFNISFICAEHRVSKVRKSKNLGLSPRIRLIGLPDSELDGQVDAGADSFLVSAKSADAMAPGFEKTMNALMTGSGRENVLAPPLCIISDFFLSWTQDVANRLGIPRYVFYCSPAAHLAVALYLPRLIEQGLVPVPPNTENIIVPGLASLNGIELPWDWQMVPGREEINNFSFRHQLRIHEAAGILINSFNGLEGQAIAAARSEALNPNRIPIYPIGPVLPSEYLSDKPIPREGLSATDNDYLQWLDAQPPTSVLFISFGSTAIPSNRQLQEIAKALDASQQAFVWILRLPPSTTEDELLPEGFRLRTQSRGLIVSTWAPQLHILSHSALAAFMSHCGWNSTLESVSRGVPILPLPQFAEQELICRMVTKEYKVAVPLPRASDGVAESGDIQRALKELMEGEEGRAVKTRVRALKEEAAKAVLKGGSSYAALHACFQASSPLSLLN